MTTPESLGLSSTRLDRLTRWGASLVTEEKLAGVLTLVARKGEVAHLACHGMADRERGVALQPDSLFRIYSMTKPITSLAILMLYEEGHFLLDDPISRFLPEFKDMRVMVGGSNLRPVTVPAERHITFRHLLTHTAGLTYGFLEQHPVDAMYRASTLDRIALGESMPQQIARLANLPLRARPGAEWHYSVSTDVLGHLVTVISGEDFADFLARRVFAPLGMTDTFFVVPRDKLPRFTTVYGPGLAPIDHAQASPFAAPNRLSSGGGGLVSTVADYLRFCQLILGGGEAHGVRLLGRKTVALMTQDHVGEAETAAGLARLSGVPRHGVGFGLGFQVMLDPARAQILGSKGEISWGGAASTQFFIDPAEDLISILMTQYMPSSTYPLGFQLRVMTYQALV
jgi:CubicO group peptidase (beta-lactamase class C family)